MDHAGLAVDARAIFKFCQESGRDLLRWAHELSISTCALWAHNQRLMPLQPLLHLLDVLSYIISLEEESLLLLLLWCVLKSLFCVRSDVIMLGLDHTML